MSFLTIRDRLPRFDDPSGRPQSPDANKNTQTSMRFGCVKPGEFGSYLINW